MVCQALEELTGPGEALVHDVEAVDGPHDARPVDGRAELGVLDEVLGQQRLVCCDMILLRYGISYHMILCDKSRGH